MLLPEKLKNVEVISDIFQNLLYNFSLLILNLGLDKIENLQNNPNGDIYHQAYDIIDKFFSQETVS